MPFSLGATTGSRAGLTKPQWPRRAWLGSQLSWRISAPDSGARFVLAVAPHAALAYQNTSAAFIRKSCARSSMVEQVAPSLPAMSDSTMRTLVPRPSANPAAAPASPSFLAGRSSTLNEDIFAGTARDVDINYTTIGSITRDLG
jgi:hypothetical protein